MNPAIGAMTITNHEGGPLHAGGRRAENRANVTACSGIVDPLSPTRDEPVRSGNDDRGVVGVALLVWLRRESATPRRSTADRPTKVLGRAGAILACHRGLMLNRRVFGRFADAPLHRWHGGCRVISEHVALRRVRQPEMRYGRSLDSQCEPSATRPSLPPFVRRDVLNRENDLDDRRLKRSQHREEHQRTAPGSWPRAAMCH
ncbi:MAG: hypothetical protein IBJ18_06860 [Phycisphaerales bacterium]|nr:hypothetical protein [Phycisphaerales bacterium]